MKCVVEQIFIQMPMANLDILLFAHLRRRTAKIEQTSHLLRHSDQAQFGCFF